MAPNQKLFSPDRINESLRSISDLNSMTVKDEEVVSSATVRQKGTLTKNTSSLADKLQMKKENDVKKAEVISGKKPAFEKKIRINTKGVFVAIDSAQLPEGYIRPI